MEIKAFQVSRPSTNLTPSSKYQLTKEQKKSGFTGVFTWAYSGNARKTFLKVILGSFMDTRLISTTKDARATNQEERKLKRDRNNRLRALDMSLLQEQHLPQYTTLKKVNGADPHFTLLLPVMIFNGASELNTITTLFGGGVAPMPDIESLEKIMASGARFPITRALQGAHLTNDAAVMFSEAATAVVFKSSGRRCVAFIEFKIPQIEAEALLSTDWLEIRPVDLYPLFTMWVEANFVSKDYGKSAVSLSKIAKTLPPVQAEDRRVDKWGISIDINGNPFYLPAECNNTELYESQFSSVGESDDGEFRFMDINTKQTPPKLPSNIPILVDWVNLKFTYSNTAGRPVIMDLADMRKCTPAAAMNILNRPIDDKFGARAASYTQITKTSPSVSLTDREYDALISLNPGNPTVKRVMGIREYISAVQAGLGEEKQLRFSDLMSRQDVLFEPTYRFFSALIPACFDNIEALNATYAVSTVMGPSMLGMFGLMLNYSAGDKFVETQAEANKQTEKARNQGVDANWTPPDAPLITKAFGKPDSGILPHQAKVRNLLRDSPDSAVLSVAAGGGKSLLSITDILYEIKASRSAPYLIMCPGHLVANYIAEFVEFTDGKVNIIPITSFNIRTTGYKRYEAMLQAAPLNTVLVVDYSALKYRARSAVYGTNSVTIYPVIEMIRKFRPGYVMLDESHVLKNSKSTTFKSVMNLITDIPKKRIASGTLNPDSPSDLASQMAILDPTILGSRDEFNDTYGLVKYGNRVVQWRQQGPNSIKAAMNKVMSNVVWCSAKRKEWACALPQREDRFINVELTENQRNVYNAIFDDMILQIRKAAEKDKGALRLLESLTGKKASKQDEDDFGDVGDVEDTEEDILDDESDIGPGLQPYLADIERFVTNPAFHEYSKNGYVDGYGVKHPPLSGDDLMAPKARVLKQLLETEYKVFDKTAGKTLVFVNYTESAKAIYEAMPEALRKCGILYSTSNKTELVNRFKRDPSIRWMIGIRHSLEVGLNLQVASNLVRLEGVWTPGQQEQGDSRIERPNFGEGGDKRQKLRFDTIVANRTIDITKAARLRAKMVALAKFENVGDPAYDSLEDIPIIPMKLDAIQTRNDFETNLVQYQDVMASLNQIRKDEYAEYRRTIEAAGGFKFTPIKEAKPPEGCAILARVPYAQGTELYKASEMGLVRVDNYVGTDATYDDDEEDTGESEAEDNSESARELRELLIGKPVHTEYGEGVIQAIGCKHGALARIHVALEDGTTARRLHSTNVFIKTRTETNSVDLRNKLAQAAGMEITGDITVPGENIRQTRMTLKQQREAERERERLIKKKQAELKREQKNSKKSISLQLNVINGYLQVGYIPSKDEAVARALEGLGFKQNPKYFYTRIKTYRQLITQAQNWADAGFTISDKYDSNALAALSVALVQNGLQSHRHYTNLMNSAQFRNYMRETFKPSADKKLLNMFAIVTDGGWADSRNIREATKRADRTGEEVKPAYGIAYLCLPAGGGHPASRAAIQTKYSAPGTRWTLSGDMLTRFVGSLRGVHKVIDELRDAGISISNIDELNRYARSVKKVVPKEDVLKDMLDGVDEDDE